MSEGLLAEVGRRVREARRARGLTQRDLAAQAGLSLRFLAQLERGQGNISLARFAELARALGESPSGLLAPGPVGEGGEPLSVALVGLRGAGKSSVGRALAARLGWPFVELDEAIERAAGLRLAEIFELHGEAYYRRLERETLKQLVGAARGQPVVIATGGGIVTDPETFRLLKERTRTVWLKAEPEDHWNRVLEQGDQRPMAENPHAFSELRALLTAREPLYAECSHVVDTSRAGGGADALAADLAAVVAHA